MGLYIRLSREDDDKALESESITNQKSLLLQYVKENNLRVYDIYVDDGYSGTTFDRPDFNRLLIDIELGKINMVITKDMSRLGRDYIGTGNLIEKYFPEHNVRYIAVTDNIDTFLDSSNNDIAPFKAIMNDMYAKDISKKIKSSLKAKMKEGKWVGGRTPFGYNQDKDNKNHLVINEEQANVVKRIFNMCLEGLSFFKIAIQLTNEGIKTPAQYYNFEWKSNYNLNYGEWHSKTIRDILTNQMYIGDMVQNRRSKVNYKVKKVIKNNPENYIIVESTHEPIIDKEIFYEVQKRIPKNKGRNEKKENHLLDGLLYCGDCGHRISIQSRRKKDNRCYTICNYYRTYMKQKLCTTHSNNYDELEKAIIKSLTEMCLDYINENKIKNSVLNNLKENDKISNKKELEILTNNIKQINDNLDTIYIDKLNKKITEEQFERIKLKLENELNIKQNRYNELNNNINDTIHEESKNKMIREYVNKFLSMKEPSRELIINLIDKIEIFEDKTINIKVSFSK
ncbi:MAG: recombinase family protein [Bacilli bacterium]|nr:recombinase family protein [Bacilli bacterium]